MSAQTYFKTAAAEIRKAIQERKNDADMKRKELADQELQTRRTIEQLNQDKLEQERRSGSAQIDNTTRVNLQRQAQQDISQISDNERSFNDQKVAIQRYIDDIERDIMSLEQLAKQLESRT